MLFRGYSRARSFEFSSRGTRWYMGLGCSRSRRSSDGRAVKVGVSIALLKESGSEKYKNKGSRLNLGLCFFQCFLLFKLSTKTVLGSIELFYPAECFCSQDGFQMFSLIKGTGWYHHFFKGISSHLMYRIYLTSSGFSTASSVCGRRGCRWWGRLKRQVQSGGWQWRTWSKPGKTPLPWEGDEESEEEIVPLESTLRNI